MNAATDDEAEQIPSSRATSIRTFAEATEVLVSKKFVQDSYVDEAVVALLGGTMVAIDGDAHFERRRPGTTFFRREMLKHYEFEILVPLLDRELDLLASTTLPGVPAAFDLLTFVRNCVLRLTVALIGLDGVDTDEATERLRQQAERLSEGSVQRFRVGDVVGSEFTSRALAAKEDFKNDFFLRSWKRRKALVEQFRKGDLKDEQLPKDILTMLAIHGPDWTDEETLREAIQHVLGSQSMVMTILESVELTLGWLAAHPEDGPRSEQAGFLLALVDETLRLRSPVPGLWRVATADFALSSGRRISDGERIFVDLAAANRDPDVFGDDVDIFNPHRHPEGAPDYGLAFGGGAKKCLGKPLVTGRSTPGRDTSLESDPVGAAVRVLHRLLKAGVHLDPARPPQLEAGSLRRRFASFPVLTSGLVAPRPGASP